MIIRTIAAMMRVLFPGLSLPLCVQQMSVRVHVCQCQSEREGETESERANGCPLKIILCVKETSSVTFHTRVALSLQ